MIIDNKSVFLNDVILAQIEKADEIIISSPFISSNEIMFQLLESNKKVTLIIRLSHPATPELLYKICPFLNLEKRVFYYEDQTLHAKIYLFQKAGRPISAIVGSSNFTDNGLYENKEMNVLMTKSLDEIDQYLKYLTRTSEGLLEKSIVDEYKKYYKRPAFVTRYKKTSIKPQYADTYEELLNKYLEIKGILKDDIKNDHGLPFTYIFDCFVHYFKVNIIKDYSLVKFTNFDKLALKKYFKIFIDDYFTVNDIHFRTKRLKDSKEICKNINQIQGSKLIDFVLKIHSVAYGSGSGDRVKHLKKSDPEDIRELIHFLVKDRLDMPSKYSLAITDKSKGGWKVRYLGPSSVGEIPGWLFPERFPIINEKFKYVLNFFKI